MRHDNSTLTLSLEACETRMDLLETYTRVDNLIIKGLPAVYSEAVHASANTDSSGDPLIENSDTTMGVVLQFCENSLDVQVYPTDISIAHRRPKGK